MSIVDRMVPTYLTRTIHAHRCHAVSVARRTVPILSLALTPPSLPPSFPPSLPISFVPLRVM